MAEITFEADENILEQLREVARITQLEQDEVINQILAPWLSQIVVNRDNSGL